jgi:transposase
MRQKDARSISAEAQEALRLRTVDAVRSGMSKVEAAEIFGVNRGTVHRWMKEYREGGKRALKKKKQGRPKGKRIGNEDSRMIARTITDRTPDQLKLPFMLWTREAVRDLVHKRTGIFVSLPTVGRWLKDWGFTPQKPVRRAFEKDPDAVKRWLAEEYPKIRKSAKKAGAQIHWGDEMAMRSDHQAGTTYGLKGKTPVIPGTGRRFSCFMISTVTNRGTLRFMVFKKKFKAEVFIEFLRRLIKSSRQKIFLIIDGHPVHRSAKVKKWVEKSKKKIRIFFLPSYSPELNPDEFLNQDVKSNAVGRRRAESQAELMADVRGYLRSTQKQPEIVKSYFHAPSVRYAL